ncbi:MAG: hypothetical protein OXG72_05910 [Acidobacteria bacterium]|nr:hypothetical protein [Acidobacteriota bacterium]
MTTFDTLTIARTLTEAGIEPAQANAITDAVRLAAEYGEHVTPEMLPAEIANVNTGIATVRQEIAQMGTSLSWRFTMALIAQTAIILGVLRLLPGSGTP